MATTASSPVPWTQNSAPRKNHGAINASAATLLVVMAALMFTSVWDDTPTSDDNVALISGYSYLRKREYRLEPQNPPLIKDLAAAPLLFLNVHEPWSQPGWDEPSDPDVLGREFLYRSGNDPDSIMRAARTPMILFTVAFGAVLFWWTRRHFGGSCALLTLFLYCFSPTFLAHGRLVATDVGATAGFFLGIITFLRFLANPTRANMALAGLAMAFALLTKFSTIALIPIVLFLAAAWVLVNNNLARGSLLAWRRMRRGGVLVSFRKLDARVAAALLRYLGGAVAIIVIAFLAVYPIYLHHVWNYTPERQLQEAQIHRQLYDLHGTARDIVLWASDKPILQPWAEYFLGLLVALKASRWGQSLFFLGTVYPTGLLAYFPFVYLVKEPLAMHVLTLVALVFAIVRAVLAVRRPMFHVAHKTLSHWIQEHFTQFAFLAVIAVYWIAVLRSNMNIGVRHLLPVFPFTFVLVANQVVRLYRSLAMRPRAQWIFSVVLGALLVWQVVSVLRVHPSYIAYFNELAGGPDGGWRYVNDSNLDWGQDVKRLAVFVEERGIPGIRVEYFGPADAGFYLKDKYLGPLSCAAPPKGWVAVSAMIYPGAPWNPTCDYRRWLPMSKLVAKVGYSIFVFHVDGRPGQQ